MPQNPTPLKQILVAEGRRQSWLARTVGIDQSEISRIANRGLVPSGDVQQRIADALGRTVPELWPVGERTAAA